MILITHILIALSSIGFSIYLLLSPTRTRLHISYAFITATLLSGSYLIVALQAPLVKSCMTGLAFTGFSLAMSVAARNKLAAELN